MGRARAICYAASLIVALPAQAQLVPQGRFQIVRADNETFLLDTATGRAWQSRKAVDLEADPDIWVPTARVDVPEEVAAVRQFFKPKTAPQK